MFVLQQIFKFIKLLHSETGLWQLTFGVIMGLFMGLTPIMTLHWFLYVLLLFVLRINMGIAFLTFPLFKMLSFPMDPLIHQLGFWALSSNSLKELWIAMASQPVIPFTRFYNTVVLGSFLMSVLLAIPVAFLSYFLIKTYRVSVVRRVKSTHLWKAMTATKLYQVYEKYEQFKN